MKRRDQGGLGLREADSGTQAGRDLDPIVVLSEIIRGCAAVAVGGPQQQVRVNRKIDVGSRRGIDSKEFRRRNSRDCEWDVVDQDGLPGGVRGASEAPLTQA